MATDIVHVIRKYRRQKIGYFLLGLLIVLPPVFIICVEYVYPFILSFISSFYHKDVLSLANYAYVFKVYGRDIM